MIWGKMLDFKPAPFIDVSNEAYIIFKEHNEFTVASVRGIVDGIENKTLENEGWSDIYIKACRIMTDSLITYYKSYRRSENFYTLLADTMKSLLEIHAILPDSDVELKNNIIKTIIDVSREVRNERTNRH